MSETKHTPGPWRFGVVKIPETRSMTDVYGFILIGGYKTFEECEKNLPLLNAAPELLAEIQKCYFVIMGLTGEGAYSGSGNYLTVLTDLYAKAGGGDINNVLL